MKAVLFVLVGVLTAFARSDEPPKIPDAFEQILTNEANKG